MGSAFKINLDSGDFSPLPLLWPQIQACDLAVSPHGSPAPIQAHVSYNMVASVTLEELVKTLKLPNGLHHPQYKTKALHRPLRPYTLYSGPPLLYLSGLFASALPWPAPLVGLPVVPWSHQARSPFQTLHVLLLPLP